MEHSLTVEYHAAKRVNEFLLAAVARMVHSMMTTETSQIRTGGVRKTALDSGRLERHRQTKWVNLTEFQIF